MQHRHQFLRLLQRSQLKLRQQFHKLLRLKLRQQRHQRRSHLVWVHLVVQFRHLRVAVVQFPLLLVVRVELLALVVHLWVVVLRAQVLVLALVVFLQVLLVAVQ